MLKKLIISIFLLGFTVASYGQDKQADLKKLFGLMQTDKMINGIMDNMSTMIKQQASSEFKSSDANTKAKFDKYMEFVMSETKELSKKLINVEMVQIYDKHFTQSEIKDLIAFYESSTGKKMIEKTPEISKDLMESMMSKYLPEFQEKMKARLDELKK